MSMIASSVTFVSRSAMERDVAAELNLGKELLPVKSTRSGIGKRSMIHNDLTPVMEVDPETYEVRADGELLTCDPATDVPMAQRYFLF